MVNTTEPKKTIKIENVVASTAIGAKLDLNEVIRVLEGADYNRRDSRVLFTGLRTRKPQLLSSEAERSSVQEQKVLLM
jgi:TATA-box binding protein (TBP) (component of TFIID and TFIIIB)